ncbi:MAG: dTMP kinase, partial [Pseudomonadota bacterium]|nr:dTMP kinase [Pseudomonadota bacterium]
MSKFIVVEGSEGVGKSTQIKTIESFLEEHNIEYIVTREPGGTSFGESIRSIILDQNNDTDNLTDSLLFYASRYENYNKIILPALKNGKTVICDRFHYSTLVYQGIVGDDELVKKVHNIFDAIFSKSIDHIIYFYTDPEDSLKRISRRSITDKFESRGLEYLNKLNKAYESTFSNMENVIKLNTSRDKDITKKDLLEKLKTI